MIIPIIVLVVVFLLIAVRQVGRFKFQIWQVMLAGAAAVLLTGQITPADAFRAIDFDVIFFLMGMFIIGQATEDSGYLSHLCSRLFGKVRSVDGLVLSVLFTLGLGSAILMNDTIAIIGVPLMLFLAKANKLSAKFLLMTLAFAVTIGSVISPIGNPQNLLIATGGGIKDPFITFFRYLFIPTVINLIAAYFLLKFFYRKEFRLEKFKTGSEHIKHARLAKVARISLILVGVMIALKVWLAVMGMFVKIDLDFKLTYIAVVGCAPVLIYRFFWKKKRFHILRRIDWSTLVFFAAMFVLMESVWASGFFQGIISELGLGMTNTGVILLLSIVVSQLISNVPMVALFLPMFAGVGIEGLMALAAGSTIAGNLFILGAASNIIIIQNAEAKSGGKETITFFEFAKVGIPLTIINVLVYWIWFMII